MKAHSVNRALEEIARGLGLAAEKVAALADRGLDQLLRRTRKQLLEAARALELPRVSRLRKEDLARRILEALHPRRDREAHAAAEVVAPASAGARDEAAAPAPIPSIAPVNQRETAAAAKLDLGPAAREEEPPQHIPWSYGLDRVTAAAVNPDRLFVYWEVTDPAIERARAALGPGGPGAWLNLRVYDTTGRLFDGTNAHGYFDHRVERWDRQWFFTIAKPTSTAIVEIGMKSSEGYFAKIARSGRVDFPRKEAAPWREPEWMTVLATGEVQHAGAGAGAPRRRLRHIQSDGHPPLPVLIPLWLVRELPGMRELRVRQMQETAWERVEWQAISGERWAEVFRRMEWAEPAVVTTWEAGPFTYPVRIAPPTRETWEGGSMAFRIGDRTHVVFGPWQVVIRNLGAQFSRAVLGRWEIFRWRLVEWGREVRAVSPALPSAAGASEQVALGASERRWVAGSELRLGGASELWRIGASELFLRGASERMYVGASEWSLRGASEVRLAGASEVRLAGGSEVRLAGASEQRFVGGSELRLGGASERAWGGASERLGGRFEGGSAAPLPYPSPDAAPSAATE
jgi:hypothetical protein